MAIDKRFSTRFVASLVCAQFLVFVIIILLTRTSNGQSEGMLKNQSEQKVENQAIASLREDIRSLRESFNSLGIDVRDKKPIGSSELYSSAYDSLGERVENIELELSDLKMHIADQSRTSSLRVKPANRSLLRDQQRLQQAEYFEQLQQWRDRIEDTYNNETEDTQWSIDTVEALNSALADTTVKPASIHEVGCMETLCKVSVVHSSLSEQSEFELMFPAQVVESLPSATMTTQENGDGSITTVVYLTRSGYKLPAMRQ